MNKVYSRINWENEPSTKTPLNEHNLNKIDFAVDEIDNRVIELDSTKAKNTDLQTLSTRVDNLILNAGDSSAECTDARVTEDGTTYDTLKKRLDAEHSSVIEDISQLSNEIVDIFSMLDNNTIPNIQFTDGYYINSSGDALSDPTWCYSEKIEVDSSVKNYLYGISDTIFISFYNGDSFISTLNQAGEGLIVNMPTATTHIVLSVPINKKYNIKLSKSESYYNLSETTSKVNKQIIAGDNATTFLDSVDNCKSHTMYKLQVTSSIPLNLPDEYPTDGATHYIYTFEFVYDSAIQKIQFIFNENLMIKWVRHYQNNKWYDWNLKEQNISGVNKQIIAGANATTFLDDVNNCKSNIIYRLQVTTSIPANLPSDYKNDGTTHYIFTLEFIYDNNIQKSQFIYDSNMNLKWTRRYQNNKWYEWKSIVSNRIETEFITVGESGNYSDLREAVEYAYSRGNVVIELLPGNHTITDFSGGGLPIGNNTKIIGCSKAVIVANYTGGDEEVERIFSVFNAQSGDFELNGVNIVSSNVRYCVHDERGGITEKYNHVFKNCNMRSDNSNSSWKSFQCIGGGFGLNGLVEIENCVFESVGYDGDYGIVSYHNSYGTGAKNVLIVKDSFFKGENATFRAGYFGESTDITYCYLSNNNMGANPILIAETESSLTRNMEIVAWNNHIRS